MTNQQRVRKSKEFRISCSGVIQLINYSVIQYEKIYIFINNNVVSIGI